MTVRRLLVPAGLCAALLTSCLLGLAALLFAPDLALATTTMPKQVTCPVCEKEITVYVISSTNTFGGADFDLCSHAAGTEPRLLRVWSCPRCWYSRWSGKFEESVEKAVKKRILEDLEPEVPLGEVKSQTDIPGFVKFGLAGTILEWEEVEPRELADHWIEAAWAVRCEGWDSLAPLKADPELSEAKRALDKKLSGWQREHPGGEQDFWRCRADLAAADLYLERAGEEGRDPVDAALHRLIAASWLRSRGENHRAAPVFKSLHDDESLPLAIRATAVSMLESISRERGFQERFLAALARAQESGRIDEENDGSLSCIAGETCRFLGRDKEARDHLVHALEVASRPTWVDKFGRAALERIKGSRSRAADAEGQPQDTE